jgi:hypothetical protein
VAGQLFLIFVENGGCANDLVAHDEVGHLHHLRSLRRPVLVYCRALSKTHGKNRRRV